MKIQLHPSALLCAFFFASITSSFAQGSLSPSGTPGPTMKSLDQIEARTPISSLPYTTSNPGAYYLSKNLIATGSSAGITVAADGVTIDLNDFTLTGGGGGSIAGISVPAPQKNLCVRNGTITGWSAGGVSAEFANGALYENLRISNNGSGDSALRMGTNCFAKTCIVESNGGPGISGDYECLVLHCNVSGNAGGATGLSWGATVSDCVIDGNGSGMFLASGKVANCTLYANGGDGIHISNGGAIQGCYVVSSGGNGITTGYVGYSIVDCTVEYNGQTGISVQSGGSFVHNCNVQGNVGSGIFATDNCRLIGNNCDGNNTARNSANSGIYVTGTGTTIDSNTCTANGNGIGITSLGTHNIIIRNTCSSNGGGNYNIPGTGAANTIGPVVDMHAGGTISNANPWINWIY